MSVFHSKPAKMTVNITRASKVNRMLKGYGNIFLFGLSITTFGVIAISVVNFFEACSVSEILKDKRH